MQDDTDIMKIWMCVNCGSTFDDEPDDKNICHECGKEGTIRGPLDKDDQIDLIDEFASMENRFAMKKGTSFDPRTRKRG